MRPATVAAGVLVIAAAGMAVAAFATGGDDDEPPPATASATPAAAPAGGGDGLAVWARHGCGGCHTFAATNSKGFIGPDLASSLRRMPSAYIKESIVAPDANIAAGYSGGMMPGDYAERIPPDELDRLVEFIRRGVPDD